VTSAWVVDGADHIDQLSRAKLVEECLACAQGATVFFGDVGAREAAHR
jgi:hypothetical protein